MNERRAGGGRLIVAGLCAAGFTVSLVALVSAQLALMSVLDAGRAAQAAGQIAESRFATELIEDTVTKAIAPVAGEAVARQAATAASADAGVTSVVAHALVEAHRQVVDPDAPAQAPDGNLAVGAAIVSSVLDQAQAAGVDPATLGFEASDVGVVDARAVARDVGVPSVVPDDLPRLGLRTVAETTRTIALVAMIVFAVGAVLAHPRPGWSLRAIGLTVAVVTGAWLVALLVVGWVIGLVSNTLFGEMLDTVWSDAVPSMLLLVIGGVVIGVGIVVAGLALDGYHGRRRPIS